MKKLSIFALVMVMAVGLTFAATAEDYIQYNFSVNAANGNLSVDDVGGNYVQYFNDISLDEGSVDIYQEADNHVVMSNKVRMDEGWLNVDQFAQKDVVMQNDVRISDNGLMSLYQQINPNWAYFDNSVFLIGSDIRFLNAAKEKLVERYAHWYDTNDDNEDDSYVWVPRHRAISFAQDYYLEENSYGYMGSWVNTLLEDNRSNEWISQQVFTYGFENATMDAWNNELGDGQGQIGMLSSEMLPNRVGGKGFINIDFRAAMEDYFDGYFWPFYNPTIPPVQLTNSSNVNGYSESKVEFEPDTGAWVNVDSFSVSWNGDWS